MNNAATTWPKPKEVAEAMSHFLLEGGANLGRGVSSGRDLATLDLVTRCRESVARLFGGYEEADPRYVTFTSNVTEAINVVLKGFLKPGMRVVTSSMEHNAVIRPLRHLEAEGVELEIVPCSKEGLLDPERFDEALKPQRGRKADLAILSHASNVCGTIQDMDALSGVCRNRGIPLVVDAAQTAGILELNASRWHLSALCFTGHKGLMGPQGTGGILWEPEFAQRCAPLVEGGTGSFSHQERQPLVLPDKFEAGTLNLPGLAGLSASLGWLEASGLERIRQRETALGRRFLDGFFSLQEAVLYGLPFMEGRLPVFALNLKGVDNAVLAADLFDRFGIESRPGLHCAPQAHRTLGSFPEGALRLSPGFFTTEDEVDVCLEALRFCDSR